MVHPKRTHLLQEGRAKAGPVIYWMSRDQRVRDNWALLFAAQKAEELGEPLAVVFSLVPRFLNAAFRQYDFMLEGLKKVALSLQKLEIPFFLFRGEPQDTVPSFVRDHDAALLITDFDPLRLKRGWKEQVARRIDVPFHEVDAHNIVPCRAASDKQEYAAYTIRPKIHRALPEFLEAFPELRPPSRAWAGPAPELPWQRLHHELEADPEVQPVRWIPPGENAARGALKDFLNRRLESYDRRRNDPNAGALSNLSPYLHFGQLSAQRVALEVIQSSAPKGAQDAFLEELVVRRELSDNFCFFNPHYDDFQGFPRWARETHNAHRDDPREHLYSLAALEQAQTHDDLWNAAQMEMVRTGKMHGYMRMYWGKKILEWTESPERALEIAFYLNDKYELDGRDPNGYVGVMWCIGGVHDRAWKERPVFGKVRTMSYNGCKSKFNIREYMDRNLAKGS